MYKIFFTYHSFNIYHLQYILIRVYYDVPLRDEKFASQLFAGD
jgi:hypothetical protein